MITLPKSTDALTEHAIPTPDGEFVLLTKRPTYQERLEDDNRGMLVFTEKDAAKSLAQQTLQRLRCCCVGWSGVQNEAGESVPFSLEALATVLTEWPAVLKRVGEILDGLFRVRPDTVGESVSKPAAGTAAAD